MLPVRRTFWNNTDSTKDSASPCVWHLVEVPCVVSESYKSFFLPFPVLLLSAVVDCFLLLKVLQGQVRQDQDLLSSTAWWCWTECVVSWEVLSFSLLLVPDGFAFLSLSFLIFCSPSDCTDSRLLPWAPDGKGESPKAKVSSLFPDDPNVESCRSSSPVLWNEYPYIPQSCVTVWNDDEVDQCAVIAGMVSYLPILST